MIGFADEAIIDVSSGDGGSGAVSFRREKYAPRGGPDGGDGGKGGSVIFEVKANLKTLQRLNQKKVYRAQSGFPGTGNMCHGKDGEDVTIPVPPGTLIRDAGTRKLLKDLKEPGTRWVFLKGGRGGKGNKHFATSTRQAPKFAQPGESGSTRTVIVELNLIADIGFVGLPNAGKSTLLSVLTNAHPKIASYPFTTKIPNLGVMRLFDRDVVMADIPGIIEGAAAGAGLGIRFLKHISRTRLLLFLIDLSQPKFLIVFEKLLHELRSFSSLLADRNRIVVGTKIDIVESRHNLEKLAQRLSEETVLGVSAVTGQGLKELKRLLFSTAGSPA